MISLIHCLYCSEQYSLREARLHLKRVRSLIQPDIQVSAQNGTDNLSLTFAKVIAGRDLEGLLLSAAFAYYVLLLVSL